MNASDTVPALLTIAGFDPSSGAGATADLAVFAAHGFYGISAITALTVQSTLGVKRVEPVRADVLAETLACLEADLPPAGVKIGMLADLPQVSAAAEYLSAVRKTGRRLFVVLDPVLQSSSGKQLLSEAGRAALLEQLLPMVDLVTPNTLELGVLTGMPSETANKIEAAAVALSARFPNLSVLTTGGHRTEPEDVLWHEGVLSTLSGKRITTSATHGTGCALSSSLLCGLVQGKSMLEAAQSAKWYVERAMLLATPRGAGNGPMQLLWPLLEQVKA